jgi:hypothetical protein
MFPPSMLASLYVKGSLKNTADGFELRLRNNIDSGTVTGMGAITVDDQSFPAGQCVVTVKQKEMRGDTIAPRSPMPVGVMTEIHIRVEGAPLAAGQHKVGLTLSTAEAGRLSFSVSDAI